ncbi:MAG: phosphoribosylformylglycinamidine cyclo-ligase [Leptospiraceae bacterium]|nr:phosphoribosylformylglycinamidine cyclo-ligase [Leptospiraceae bacterium]
MSDEITYKSAGVDTEAGQDFVKKIKNNVNSTHNPNVLNGLGGFSAAYDISFLKNYKNPVLLSGTDGVGTKLELARLLNIHNTIGIDLVAMCVNDLLVSGARPLFFLDYISCGKLDVEKMEKIVSGIVEGCRQCGAALVGGETAEHPGLMKEDEYDLAGFAVGAVEKEDMIDGSKIKDGDIIIGLDSSGPHSNGFSLIRKLYLKEGKHLPESKDEIDFITNYLMKPTKIYVDSILKLLQKEEIKGMVHITGGGFYENIPRILPDNLDAIIELSKVSTGYTFEKIKRDHKLSTEVLYSTFNMGVGYLIICDPSKESNILETLSVFGENSTVIGKISNGNKKVILK